MNKNRSESDLFPKEKREKPIKKFASEFPINEDFSRLDLKSCVLLRNTQGYEDLYALNYEKSLKKYEVLTFPLYFSENRRFSLKENLVHAKYQLKDAHFFVYVDLLLYIFRLDESESLFLLKSKVFLSDFAVNPDIFLYFCAKVRLLIVAGGENSENTVSFYEIAENYEKVSLVNLLQTKKKVRDCAVFLQKYHLVLCDFALKQAEVVKLKGFQSEKPFQPVEIAEFPLDFPKTDVCCEFVVGNAEEKALIALKNEEKLYYLRIKESGVKMVKSEFSRPKISFASNLLQGNMFVDEEKLYVLCRNHQKDANYLKVYEINK